MHQWEIYERVAVYDEFDTPGQDLPNKFRYVMRCKECGLIKKVDV